MASSSSLFFFPLFLLLLPFPSHSSTISTTELTALLTLKSTLDPSNTILTSWSDSGDPCKDDTFEGVCCNEHGQVANISLQSKGLTGILSPAIGELKHLTGLYLHYNSLVGEIPKEVAELRELSDLYLNVNNISGEIPSQFGEMENLQVLQLCYNQLTGSIPTQLGSLKKLTVIALQGNQLTGAIPASLGDVEGLVRVDLSFNQLFGSIPARLANASQLETFDVRNNSLSGSVPPALKRLNQGFLYTNNKGLCGIGFTALSVCTDSDLTSHHTLPQPTNSLPETANILSGCNPPQQCTVSPHPNSTHHSHASFAFGILAVLAAVSVIGFIAFARHRRHKQKLSTSIDYTTTDNNRRLSIDIPTTEFRKNGSPLISLEYPNGWDPLASHHDDEEDIIHNNFRFNSEEIESATQHFSPINLLGPCRKTGFSSVYRGMLRDGSVVAIKKISKSSCKSEEAEFLKGLNVLTSLRHENLVKLRGICCSKGRGECFLVYEFVTNGNLLKYLDVKDGDSSSVLDWETRVSIIKGVAKGIQYLHSYKVNKPPLVHQNISAEKILLDQRFNPLLSDSGLHKLLTNDTVFSTLKSSAAMGYLAPEYTTTGKFTEKSDVYAFGVLVLQILSGRRKITQSSIRLAAEGGSSRFDEFVDSNLLLGGGKFSEQEAVGLVNLAISCTHESAFQRPSMEAIGLELGKYGGSSSSGGGSTPWLYTSP